MTKIQTYGTIESGKLRILKRQEFEKAVKNAPDCEVKITVSKLYDKRSNQQNKYYWGVIIDLFRKGWEESQGEKISMEQAHEILKHECNYSEIVNPTTGAVIRTGNTTTELNTKDYEEYLTRCRNFIWEWFNIIVPLPDREWRHAEEIQINQ